MTAFKSELSKDKMKLKWIIDRKHGSLEEVLASVVDARLQYEARRGDSKVRRILVELAEKIHYYSNVMDVMIQQYPEYTSLVWGAMKVLFVVGPKAFLRRGSAMGAKETIGGCESTKFALSIIHGSLPNRRCFTKS